MDAKRAKGNSKFLALLLRHKAADFGLVLSEAGWAEVSQLLQVCAAAGNAMTEAELVEVVRTNDKQRFALSEDGKRIRASQGHSIEVALGYDAVKPPALLLHGTVKAARDSIRAQGLLPGARQHVHLSETIEVAKQVGARRGAPVVLRIDAARMHHDGELFYQSANGVWLTLRVPPQYILQSGP
jgi:putative RNA 2'-phosphotransferase